MMNADELILDWMLDNITGITTRTNYSFMNYNNKE